MPPTIHWQRHGGQPTNDDRWARYGHCARCHEELLRVILAPDPDVRAKHGVVLADTSMRSVRHDRGSGLRLRQRRLPRVRHPHELQPARRKGHPMVRLLEPVLSAGMAALEADQDADLYCVSDGLPDHTQAREVLLTSLPSTRVPPAARLP
jgi:hypothetical protein